MWGGEVSQSRQLTRPPPLSSPSGEAHQHPLVWVTPRLSESSLLPRHLLALQQRSAPPVGGGDYRTLLNAPTRDRGESQLATANLEGEVPTFDQLNLVPSSLYTCPVCGMQFYHKAMFRHHYMIHSGEKPKACSYCTFRTRQGGTLRAHIRIKHPEMPQDVPKHRKMIHGGEQR